MWRKRKINEYFLMIIISFDLSLWFIVFFANGRRGGNYDLMWMFFMTVQITNKAFLVRAIIELYKGAYTDMLTGLYNRRYFYKRMERVKMSSPLSLLFIDIDNFKAINDEYGHIVGDWVLQRFAGMLQNHARKKDVIARWGGEEFVMVLFQTSNREAFDIADMIRREVEGHIFNCDGVTINITISIGIASIKEGTIIDIKQMLKVADKALYKAKENKNYVMVGK